MSRYVCARHYLSFGVVALALAAFSGWLGLTWAPAFCPAALFLLTAVLLLGLAVRPAIQVYDGHLEVGKRSIAWSDIRRVDRTGWISPLVVRLTLYNNEEVLIVYPGEVDCCKHLLRAMRQLSRDAAIDGIPYRQYWGEMSGPAESEKMAAPRYRMLRQEDEEEVERLYFLLKTVGHLDPRNSSNDER